MKTIGLIGGMSWESSQLYYQVLNERVKARKGGLSSCPCLLYSVDFAKIEQLQHAGEWGRLKLLMAEAARKLYRAGADLIILCTNTMHLCSEAIRAAVPIPFLHIAEATGARIQQQGLRRVGLLGTRFTMEMPFYQEILSDGFGIETLVPEPEDRAEVHRIIYEELVLGIIRPESRTIYQSIITRLQTAGTEGIILGCTEIPLLISPADVSLPLFDTTTIHAEEAVAWAMQEDPS